MASERGAQHEIEAASTQLSFAASGLALAGGLALAWRRRSVPAAVGSAVVSGGYAVSGALVQYGLSEGDLKLQQAGLQAGLWLSTGLAGLSCWAALRNRRMLVPGIGLALGATALSFGHMVILDETGLRDA